MYAFNFLKTFLFNFGVPKYDVYSQGTKLTNIYYDKYKCIIKKTKIRIDTKVSIHKSHFNSTL